MYLLLTVKQKTLQLVYFRMVYISEIGTQNNNTFINTVFYAK